MSWVRGGSVLAACCVHAAAAAAFVFLSVNTQDLSALESGAGKDDLSVVATVTLQTEESVGLDAINAERQDASAASKPVPETKQQEVKRDDAIEMDPPPPEESAPPQPPIQPKPVEKQEEKQDAEPTAPSFPAAAQEEQHAMSRDLEARRSQLLSLYCTVVYRALMKHALFPKTVQKGRVIVELTLAPSGELLTHRVVESSGSDLLDRTAIVSLEHAAPFPPTPEELSKEPHTLRIPFEYAVK